MKRQGRILHNGQGINQRKSYNNWKYIAHNLGESQYIRQMLTAIKGKIDRKTIIVGDLKTPLTPMDRSSR